MKQLFLRRETFGGVLYHIGEGRLQFLNRTGYEICFGIASGWIDDEILTYVMSRFQVDDPDLVRSDIHTLRKAVLDPVRLPKRRTVAVGGEVSGIPTLSAPLEIHWEITGRCNLECLHCYNNSSRNSPEPTLDQIRSVTDELKEAKIKVRGIIVTGGEPLMHPHLREILETLRPLAAEVVLATNGALVRESNIDWIAGMVDAVNISIDSSNADSFSRFRGHPGILDKTVNALRLFVKHGIPVVAQSTISRYNVDSLDDLALLLKSEGAASWIIRLPIRMGRARNNEQHFLTVREAQAKEPLFRRIRGRYASDFDVLQIGNRFMWSYDEPFIQHELKSGLATCAAGTILAVIRPDGTMVPCAVFGDTTSPEVHSLPVWNGRFLSEWRNAECFKMMREIKLERIVPCNRCAKLPDTCDGGCRAIAFHTFGSVYGPDPDCNYVRALRCDQSP
jgi:radical SAM protein with 4Fe4S-binding SPASM domain